MSQLTLTAVGDITSSLSLTDQPQRPLGPDDLLIAVEAAPINNADVLLAAGWYAIQPAVPFAMGTEGVGRVLEAGSDTYAGLVGRRVLILPTNEQGTWADRVVVAARNVLPVSETGDPVQQAMLTVNPATAYLLLHQYVQLKPGDWVGQDLGNSAVGQHVIALARRAGVRTLSVVRSEAAAEALRKRGGDVVLVDGDDLAQRIAGALDGRSLRLALTGGDLVFRELSLHGFWVIKWLREAPRTEIEATYALLGALLDDGTLHADVDSTFPLARYRAAIERAAAGGRSGKVLLVNQR
jgi:NADPH:quinone reductase-like Zn-dependent oxidoreductase